MSFESVCPWRVYSQRRMFLLDVNAWTRISCQSSITISMLHWKNHFPSLSKRQREKGKNISSTLEGSTSPHNKFSNPQDNHRHSLSFNERRTRKKHFRWNIEKTFHELVRGFKSEFRTDGIGVLSLISHGFSLFCYSFFPCYVFADKMPAEKRDSIISEKKISPNGQGLYFHFHPSDEFRKRDKREVDGKPKVKMDRNIHILLFPSSSTSSPSSSSASKKTFHFLANHFTFFFLSCPLFTHPQSSQQQAKDFFNFISFQIFIQKSELSERRDEPRVSLLQNHILEA